MSLVAHQGLESGSPIDAHTVTSMMVHQPGLEVHDASAHASNTRYQVTETQSHSVMMPLYLSHRLGSLGDCVGSL